MIRFHKDGTVPPADGRVIWVFGANEEGRHGKGAALLAAQRFGAVEGIGEGPTGWAYAIPTKGHRHGRKVFPILPLTDIAAAVVVFKAVAARSRRLFFVTRVGCGLAGYTDDEIAPLFRHTVAGNFSFAEAWRPWLENGNGIARD